MKTFNSEYSSKFHFENSAAGNAEVSLETATRGKFTAYYVTAGSDTNFDGNNAVELTFKHDDCRFTAIYSHSLYWVQPSFGERMKDIPQKTAALILENDDGTYTYVMSAIGSEYKTYIKGTDAGIVVYLYSQYPAKEINFQLSFIVGTGTDVLQLTEDGAAAMCKFMDNGLKLRAEKSMPEIFEYFGWCSWDAFQIRVNHKGLIEKAKEFSDKNVPVRYAIIDDMWGDAPNLKTVPFDSDFNSMVKTMHASSLDNFEGDPERFPEGLAAAVSDIKAHGIDNVGLWFPTTGYWYGLTEGKDAYKLQEGNTVKAAGGRIIARPEEDSAIRYFDVFCKRARDFGCDFVKIDNQSCHFFYDGMYPIGVSSKNIQKAIDKAAFEHFGGALINCMGMPVECMLNRPESAVSRCSDDFMPESVSWFAKNILECAYNGLLQGRFYINDWDMWWTDDAQAGKNSVCHAISGGPIYVSDKLGRTNPDVLYPLMFDDGRILRLNDSAVPTADCVIGNPTKSDKLFKIRNSFTGGAAVAVFNISESGLAVSGAISAENAGLLPDKTYLFYEYFSGDFGYVNGDENIYLTLDTNNDFRYYTFIEKSENKPLFIGRIDKFNPRIAVISEKDGEVELYEGGDFAFIADEDYLVTDEFGNEIECDRYGLIVTGTCDRNNKILKFEKI